MTFDELATCWLKPFIFTQPAPDSSIDGAKSYAADRGSIFKQYFVAFKDYISVRSSVVHLVSGCSPSAIVFGIVAIVIYSVNAVFMWTPSHIFEEVFKFRPSFTVTNAAPSIVWPLGPIFVVTSSLHSRPYPVLGGHFSACGIAVTCGLFGAKLFAETAATNNKPAPKSIHGCDANASAVA